MRMRNGLLLAAGVASLSLVPALPAAGQCTIAFDTSCPTASPECGATFSGGLGCIVAGLGFCYDTGSYAYELDESTPVTVLLDPAVSAINVFFAYTGGTTSGAMRFFSADSTEIGTAITTNGSCQSAMPPRQQKTFTTPVARIEITMAGSGSGWVDTMELTSAPAPVETATWGLLKARYH